MLIGATIEHFGLLHDVCLGLSETALLAKGLSGPGQTGSLKPLTVLVGRNQTGKSSFLDGLSFLSDCVRYDVRYAATLRGRKGFSRLMTKGAKEGMRFSLLFHLPPFPDEVLVYDLALSCDSHGRPAVSQESVKSIDWRRQSSRKLLCLRQGEGTIQEEDGSKSAAKVGDLKHPALAVYGLMHRYPELCAMYQHVRRWFMGRPHEAQDGKDQPPPDGGHEHVSPSFDNLENVLDFHEQENPQFCRDMIARIGEKMPDSDPVDKALRAGEMTEGSRKLLAFLLLLHDPRPRPLICLEEPDVGLYHDMVETLGQEMRAYTLRQPDCQIFFTTHNPFMLESVRPEEVWVFRRQAGRRGEPEQLTRTHCAGGNPLIRSLHEQGVGMSAIWYGGHLDEDLEA